MTSSCLFRSSRAQLHSQTEAVSRTIGTKPWWIKSCHQISRRSLRTSNNQCSLKPSSTIAFWSSTSSRASPKDPKATLSASQWRVGSPWAAIKMSKVHHHRIRLKTILAASRLTMPPSRANRWRSYQHSIRKKMVAVNLRDSSHRQPKTVVGQCHPWRLHAVTTPTSQTSMIYTTRLSRSNWSRLGQFRSQRPFLKASSTGMSSSSKWPPRSNKSCQMRSRITISATISFQHSVHRSTEHPLKWTLVLIARASI